MMRTIRFFLALIWITCCCHVPAPAGFSWYPSSYGPNIDCYWTKADIDDALATHEQLWYESVAQTWVPITSSIVVRWWSVDATPTSPNAWKDPAFSVVTIWDWDNGMDDNKLYSYSYPILTAWEYDTWRVDSVAISTLYQSMAGVASRDEIIIEVTAYFWGPELAGDQLHMVFSEPEAITVRDSHHGDTFNHSSGSYTYYTGCPIPLID